MTQLYLHRILFNDNNATRFILDDRYRLHAALAGVFSGDPRVLWRLDGMPGARQVLVQSHQLPEWSAFKPATAISQVETKVTQVPALPPGQYAFAVYANVAKRQAGVRRRRAILDESAQRLWFARKLAGVAEIVEIGVRSDGKQIARKNRFTDRTGSGGRTYNAVWFSGLLQVVDGAALAGLIERGIGPGKHCGFGMLSLARIE